ncbi:MAG: hypothetical protein IKB71_01060 [Lentisphaeria bacterium]|nr:hypothetical protein [Lentisphaeria bacterium]
MNKITLNGVWAFSFAKDKDLSNDLPEINFSTALAVPGCFDTVQPFFGERGTGFYKTSVRIGGNVRLCIDGAGVEAKIFWDKKYIGDMPYAYMPEKFYFDAGDDGEHELIVAVSNRFNKKFFPYFDFYAYGGIFGNVTIEKLPQYFLDNIKVTTLDYTTGRISVELDALKFIRKKCAVTFEIDNKKVFDGTFSGKKQSYELNVPNFKLWSPDSPALHKLRVIFDRYEEEVTFGIRTLEIRGTDLFLNGGKLRLMGYNRHDSHPQFGAAMPESLIAADLAMIKQQGCNFIRGSHYPQRKALLDLCDRNGILFWEETLGWDVRDEELFTGEFRRSQIDQAKKLANIHYNHPCIIIWGFMNETLSEDKRARKIIKSVYDAYKSVDSTRWVTFASNRYERDICMDIVDIVAMNPYPGWYDMKWEELSGIHNIEPRLQRLADAIPEDKPFMVSEIGASAIYGHRDPHRVRWSEEYQAELAAEVCRVVFGNPRICGLAFWHFCDAKSYLNGGRVMGVNDKGMLDQYRRPKLAWNVITETLKKLDFKGK